MRAIKRLNNNVVICLTAKGREVIARGKGIGFHDIPYDVPLSAIERTYYDVDDKYISVIENIDDQYLQLAGEIIDYTKEELNTVLNNNIIFTLADHLQFSIERHKKKMVITLPIMYDIQYMYPEETSVGKYAVKLIKEKTGIALGNEESAMIALHIINAEAQQKNKEEGELLEDRIVADITGIIEREFGITIEKQGFNYSRFVSHINYLLRRSKNKEMIQSENKTIYEKLKQESPNAYLASEKISAYLKERLKIELTDEEKLYLILHINRLSSREECNH